LEMARMTESAYRFERDDATASFIKLDNWAGDRAGLLSGEKLMLQLQEMEKAFIDSNQRDFEINQTFSLAQIDPLALHKLRQKGSTTFKIDEVFFDITYPGQYARRI